MKKMNMAIYKTLKTQAQAEGPRLLLATLALLIVGLMINPAERNIQNTQELALEIPVKSRTDLKSTVADLKIPSQR